MGIFCQPEWNNFIRVSRGRLWLWPHYGVQISALVMRRLANALRIRLAGSNHRGLKRRPAWLPPIKTRASSDACAKLVFPAFTSAASPQQIEQPRFATADPEAYFFSQRWSNCYAAALGDENAAAAALDAVLGWIRSAPPKNDAAWETYSTCERVVNLAVMLSVHAGCRRRVEQECAGEISRFFDASAHWIDSRLEYYGMTRTNNHCLNNARALVVAGSILGDATRVAQGLLLFTRMARQLFQPGGFLRERSSHYQVVVTNWLFDTLHFARTVAPINDTAQAALIELETLAGRVATATAQSMHAFDGIDTQIGDISPDNHPTAASARLRRLYPSIFPTTAKADDWQLDDWICISGRGQRLLACGMPSQHPFEYTTHGHPDLGGFVWTYQGNAVLVDAGRMTYHHDATSSAQSAASGHNVLLVQTLPALAGSLLAGGRWCPTPYARATVRLTHKPCEGFAIEHDGFRRIAGVGPHRRSVSVEDDGISVVDQLDGSGRVDIELLWHFAPGLAPMNETDTRLLRGNGLQVVVMHNDTDEASSTHWENYPYSACYGGLQQGSCLHVRRSVTLPWSGTTTLRVTPCAA